MKIVLADRLADPSRDVGRIDDDISADRLKLIRSWHCSSRKPRNKTVPSPKSDPQLIARSGLFFRRELTQGPFTTIISNSIPKDWRTRFASVVAILRFQSLLPSESSDDEHSAVPSASSGRAHGRRWLDADGRSRGGARVRS